MMSFSTLEFRKAMGEFATGITVVTCPHEDQVKGMTANSFTSISLEPPLVLISVDKRANHIGFIQGRKCFGISVLGVHQEDVSRHFAGKPNPELDKKLNYVWHDGIPMLGECNISIACRLWATYDGGDHTIFLGEVLELYQYGGDPLIFFRGNYGVLESDNT